MAGRLLTLAHAVLWRTRPYLVHVGLDDGGVARAVGVTALSGWTVDAADLVGAAGLLTDALAESRLASLVAAYPADAGPMGFLAAQALAIERQAGPIVMFAHRMAAGRDA